MILYINNYWLKYKFHKNKFGKLKLVPYLKIAHASPTKCLVNALSNMHMSFHIENANFSYSK